jgi:hypothetical protein
MALGWGSATLVVHFEDEVGKTHQKRSSEWDLALDRWLVEQGAKATSAEAEVLRTAIRLKAYMEPVFQPYGEGVVNDQLYGLMKHGPLSDHPAMVKLCKLSNARPRQNLPFNDEKTRELAANIDEVLAGLAGELTRDLKYPRPEAEHILGDAVAQYLDERFHLTEHQRKHGR